MFLRQCHHNRLLAVPAGLYSVNNYLKFAMQLYFKPTTAKMLSNLKVHYSSVQPQTVLFQKSHPYTGNLKPETSGDSKPLRCGGVLVLWQLTGDTGSGCMPAMAKCMSVSGQACSCLHAL